VTDLLPRIRTALAGRYDVERELGQGGMATVYLAQDLRHKRPVAVKVLSPEIAHTVGADRFLREIEIAARLTHPHILPVFDSGVADGILYYVMPYIRGESLRHRLRRDRQLSVQDALRIAREVASALDYAHRQSIVHRDIKPENVLLEEGHAVVADFGVARAFAAAGQGQRLTGTGLAIGTPSYMSPEQASGEAAVDGRSDVYALGCVLYEMLAGVPPFEGPLQSLVRQHIMETPRRVATLRPDVPAGIVTTLNRALAKTAAARWPTAGEFARALETEATTPAAGLAAPGRRRRIAVGALIAAVTGATAVAVARQSGGPPLDANRVAVAPFDVLVPALELWREGLVDVLSRDLDGAGPLRTVAPTIVVRRWRGRADAPSAAALGRSTGARLAVFGQVLGIGGDSVRVQATLYDVGAGRSLGDVEVHDVSDRIDRVADSLTMALLRELGRTRPIGAVRLTSMRSASLPALKAFLQGEQFYRRTDWDSAIAYYERAIALDSTFALPLRRVGVALGWQRAGGDSLSRRYHLRAGALNRGLSPRDSLLVTADSLNGVLYSNVPDTAWFAFARRLFATVAEVTRRYPEDPEAWYALGEARFHLGFAPLIGASRREALQAFDRAIALDSSFGPAYIHPVDLALNLDGPDAARRYIAAYLALDPKDINARSIRLIERILDPALARHELDRLIDTTPPAVLTHALIGCLSRFADSGEVAVRAARSRLGKPPDPAFFGGATPDVLLGVFLGYRGHLREADSLARAVVPTAFLSLALLGAVPADSADRVFAEWARSRNPAVQAAPPWWAMRGDTTRLLGMVRFADSVARRPSPRYPQNIMRYRAAAARAYLALARRDTAAALERFLALPDSLCPWCYPEQLARVDLLVARGREREAAPLVDRELWPQALADPRYGGWVLQRGRVHERLGNRDQAIDAYRFVADLWRNADPELQPLVQEARTALSRLTGEPQPLVGEQGARSSS
jgi:eukaryotic-like serine/threonine-protein kinase